MQGGFKIFIILFIIAIGVFGFYYKNKKTSTPPSTAPEKITEVQEVPKKQEVIIENSDGGCTGDCIKHFIDPNNIFSFDYNSLFQSFQRYPSLTTNWSLNSKRNGTLLATITIPKTYLPDTNFSGARFTIGRSTDNVAIKNCINKTVDSYIEEGLVAINGYFFKKFSFSDAGAGNFYDSVSYRGIVDGDCYAIEYMINYTNIANYSPDQGIKEFDKTKVQTEIEKIIRSLKFKINND